MVETPDNQSSVEGGEIQAEREVPNQVLSIDKAQNKWKSGLS